MYVQSDHALHSLQNKSRMVGQALIVLKKKKKCKDTSGSEGQNGHNKIVAGIHDLQHFKSAHGYFKLNGTINIFPYVLTGSCVAQW